jgi:SPP1 family predicted phage head-tail adaptor
MINPGELTHQITIQIKSITQDSELNAIETWRDWRPVWAHPLSKTSREFYRLSTNNSEITEVFKIRYIAGVTARQRIKFGNRYLEIIGDPINTGEKYAELLLTCKAVV